MDEFSAPTRSEPVSGGRGDRRLDFLFVSRQWITSFGALLRYGKGWFAFLLGPASTVVRRGDSTTDVLPFPQFRIEASLRPRVGGASEWRTRRGSIQRSRRRAWRPWSAYRASPGAVRPQTNGVRMDDS